MDQDSIVKNDTKKNDLILLINEKPFVNELNVSMKDITVLKFINRVPLILFKINSFLNEKIHKRTKTDKITATEIIKDSSIS